MWAATDEADPLVAHAIVPADAPGIRIEKTWDHLGMRATSTHDVIYDGVEIPFENFRGTRHSELPREFSAGNPTGLAVAALYVGIGRAAQRFFVRFAHERVPSTRAAISAVQTALAAIGNPRLTRHHPLERHFRDVQGARPHPPQDDAALLLAGRRSLEDLRPDPTPGDPS